MDNNPFRKIFTRAQRLQAASLSTSIAIGLETSPRPRPSFILTVIDDASIERYAVDSSLRPEDQWQQWGAIKDRVDRLIGHRLTSKGNLRENTN